MPSVSDTYGRRPVTERQLARLFAIAYGGRDGQPGALGGTKRQKILQLNEMLEKLGYEWDAIDQYAPPELWIRQGDYDELVSQLEVIRGGKL